ncbi:MAG: amidophosphoribosyltransferase [Candidatus Micrarchaeales archaeon]
MHKDGEKILPYARVGLDASNHRGEEGLGIGFVNPETGKIEVRREMGLVRDSHVFDKRIFGSLLIGHTRYRTSSTCSMENLQPIPFSLKDGTTAAISHNGNITNDRELLKKVLKKEQKGISDTKVIGMLLGQNLGKKKDVDAVRESLSRVVGSYSMVVLVGGERPRVLVIRDPYGYMPLRIGRNRDGFFVASESVAFGNKYLNAASRDVAPGEMVVMDQKGMVTYQLFERKREQHCMFQAVYMYRPDSQFEGKSVAEIREKLGFEVAGRYRPDVNIIIPIPETGWDIGLGYSRATGIPIRRGVVRDRYESGRSFMRGDQLSREKVVNRKLNVIPEIVRGKHVLITEDSLVRGTTMKGMINEIRAAGAEEIHVAFSCPPITDECRYGIDFYNDKLIARSFKGRPAEEINREIAKEIGADSVYYQTMDGLIDALAVSREKLCLSCLTGVYVQPGSFMTEEERKK